MSRFARLRRCISSRSDRSDRGASVIEYALLAGAFGLAVVGGMGSLVGQFDTAYDDRQPQYGTPHVTNQTTTTAVATSSTSSSSSSSTSSTSTTTSTTVASTTTTTAPPVNQSYWWQTPYWVNGVRWRVTTDMYLLRNPGNPYANTSVTISYFNINQFPIGQVTGTTNSLGYLQLTSPEFKKTDHTRVFIAVTDVGGSSNWDGTLTGWVDMPS